LILLSPEEFEEGKPLLQPYRRYAGAYFDPLPGLRVYGMRYYGAATSRAIEGYAAALAEMPRDGVEYTIFMTHAGVEGVLGDDIGGVSYRQLAVMQPYADYVALGHVHKPFEMDGWIHNPGSTETCTTQEAQWRERGYYLVEVDTSRKDTKHVATLRANPRRHFERLSVKVDLHTSPDALCDHCRELVARKARDLRIERMSGQNAPVVEVQLTGVLAFDRSALDLSRLEQIVKETLSPLHVLMRNLTRATEFEIESAAEVSRPELERQVLGDLFARDARYRDRSGLWTRTALAMKRLAIEGASAEAVVEELEHRIEEIDRSLASGSPYDSTQDLDQNQKQGQRQQPEAMSHADPVG
jgi:exonuclease SbcD